jgi:hypothetical protein
VTVCEDSHFFDVIIVQETLASKELLQAQELMNVTWPKTGVPERGGGEGMVVEFFIAKSHDEG